MDKLKKDIICSLGFGINISLVILFFLRDCDFIASTFANHCCFINEPSQGELELL